MQQSLDTKTRQQCPLYPRQAGSVCIRTSSDRRITRPEAQLLRRGIDHPLPSAVRPSLRYDDGPEPRGRGYLATFGVHSKLALEKGSPPNAIAPDAADRGRWPGCLEAAAHSPGRGGFPPAGVAGDRAYK